MQGPADKAVDGVFLRGGGQASGVVPGGHRRKAVVFGPARNTPNLISRLHMTSGLGRKSAGVAIEQVVHNAFTVVAASG
jgi:hypothetical protein